MQQTGSVRPSSVILSDKPAAANRRANRAAKTEWLRRRSEQRCVKEREVAVRMTRRWYPDGRVPLITLDYRYWQAMRCGWNPMSPDFRRTLKGLIDPHETQFWEWWTALHYKTRSHIIEEGRVRVVRHH